MKAPSIQANWQPFEKRPVWSYVSVQEVARAMSTSPQSIHNWVGRGHLIPLEKKPGFRAGNKKFFQLCKLRAFLEKRDEESICWEWIRKHLPPEDNYQTIQQAQYMVKHCYYLLGVERP